MEFDSLEFCELYKHLSLLTKQTVTREKKNPGLNPEPLKPT